MDVGEQRAGSTSESREEQEWMTSNIGKKYLEIDKEMEAKRKRKSMTPDKSAKERLKTS